MRHVVGNVYLRAKKKIRIKSSSKGLLELVNSMPIHPEGTSTADKLETEYNAMAWYRSLKDHDDNSKYFARTIYNLYQQDEAEYSKSVNALLARAISDKSTPFQQKIINAARTMQSEINYKNHYNQKIDYYFYNRVAKNLTTLYDNPNSADASQRIADDAEYAFGAGSFGKRFIGSLLLIVGILLLSACVAGLIALAITPGVNVLTTALILAGVGSASPAVMLGE